MGRELEEIKYRHGQSGRSRNTNRKNATERTNNRSKKNNNRSNSFEPEMPSYYKNKKSKKMKKKNKKVLKIVLSILLALIIILGTIFGTYVYKAGGSITGAVMNMVKDVIGEQDPIFVLVMGVSEDISAELTDTIMLIGYKPETNQAFVLSIPRDTFIGNNEATAGGFDKINALYQKSPEKTVEAVQNLTGVKIDYYVTVKNSALVEIVDTIGGVEFDVPINMDYDDPSQNLHIHLKKGKQLLNGDKSEQLVRFRHNNNGSTYSAEYGDNDEGRMRTQREFLKTVATQVISWNNVDKIKELTTAVFKNLETNITLSKVLGYVPYVATFNMENLSMDQLPGTPQMINQLWFYKADLSETKELIDEYVDKLGLTETEKQKHITKQKITASTTNKNNTTKKETTNKSDNEKNTTNTTNMTNTTKNTVENNTINQNKTTNTTNKSNTTNKVSNSTTNNTEKPKEPETSKDPEKPSEKEKPNDNDNKNGSENENDTNNKDKPNEETPKQETSQDDDE